MKPSWLLCYPGVFLLLLVLSPGLVAAVELEAGSVLYRGVSAKNGAVQAFLGVPFAQPPFGGLRWQPPLELASLPRSIDARSYKPACAQGPHMVAWYRDVVSSFGGNPDSFTTPQTSEDCLYLNIWKPADIGESSLPVIVFIHGGSNKGGWSYEPNYIGENLAHRGAVVVTIPYRVGVLGFFSHPEQALSNFGLLDQIAALTWLQENISDFGGDPGNVTVMGESAGANDIVFLMVSPLAQGLFQRAVLQSGGWSYNGRGSRQEQLSSTAALQQTLLGEQGNLDALRNIPVDELLAGAATVLSGHSFEPVIDGHSLLEPIARSMQSGRFRPVDLLIGSNADEWLMYLDEKQSVAGWLEENLEPGQVAAARAALPATLEESRRLDRLITADAFVCPSMAIAQRVAEHGGRSWFYYFTRQREGEKGAQMGAYHGAELPYVFDTHDDWLPTTSADRELTQTIMQYWLNFARSGDPNGAGLPPWAPFVRERGLVQQLDEVSLGVVHPSLSLCNVLLPVDAVRPFVAVGPLEKNRIIERGAKP